MLINMHMQGKGMGERKTRTLHYRCPVNKGGKQPKQEKNAHVGLDFFHTNL